MMLSYYHIIQSDYSNGASAAAGGVTENCSQNSTALVSGAGMDAVSLVADWKFAPKWDTYLGTMYEKQFGGMVSGFQAAENWTTTAGGRFRW
jgi:hypothetical protein